MKILFIATAFLLIAPTSLPQGSKVRSDSVVLTGRAIEELDKSYNQALTKQDLSALNLILADDYFCTSSTGNIRRKADEIDDVRPATDFIMPSLRSEDVNVRLYSGAAVVTGRVVLSARYPDKLISTIYRYTRVYTNLNGHLQLTVQQLTLIEGEALKHPRGA